MTKTTRTRSDYLAQLQREKAERLIGAIQEVAKTGDVKPFKERCWAMKSQENKRIKRAKQRRDSADVEGVITSIIDDAFSHMKRSRASRPTRKERRRTFADDSQVLVYRNPLNLSPGWGVTAMHVACQLFTIAVQKGDQKVIRAMEEVVDVLIRLGASPTRVMRDHRTGREMSCIELCPRKPGSTERMAPKALVDALRASAKAPATQAVRIERHAGVAKALKQRRERLEAPVPALPKLPVTQPAHVVWMNLPQRQAARASALN